MCTVGDVLKVGESVSVSMNLYGYTTKFAKEWTENFQAIGRAICREQGVEFGDKEVFAIPEDTPLGQESVAMFEKLKKWLSHHKYPARKL